MHCSYADHRWKFNLLTLSSVSQLKVGKHIYREKLMLATAQNVQHYQPSPAIVAPRSQIIWDNKDFAPHTATALDGSFDTGTIQPGASGLVVVPSNGTIPYHCTIHPWMTAILQVSSSSSPSSSSTGGSTSSLQQNGTGEEQLQQQQEQETKTARGSNNITIFNQSMSTASNAAEGLQQITTQASISQLHKTIIVAAQGDLKEDDISVMYAHKPLIGVVL